MVRFAFARGAGRLIRRPPEVRSLAAAFNHTAARLAHLLSSQRAFAGEASTG